MNQKILLFIILKCLLAVNTSKILMVFNHFGKSHYIQGRALGKGLARAGHEVLMVSPFEETSEDTQKGYNEIVLNGLAENIGVEVNFVKREYLPAHLFILKNNHFFEAYTNKSINHPKFQELLHSKYSFDVIILEDLFYTALRGLSCHFKIPLILYSPFAPTNIINHVAGLPAPPSYVPNIWMGYPHSMNFWQRSINFFYTLIENLNIYNGVYPLHQQLVEKYFPDCPDLCAINKNVSAIFMNSHESVNPPIPLVPNIVNILGFHLKDENHLKQDMQEYMDNAQHGVILFSFGTFVQPSGIDTETKKAILRSLGKLKEKVIWKSNEEDIPGKPDNIRLSKWLPQEDLLAHPNTKLFITHAGLTSTIETIYHGVPVLAVPLAADQMANAARIAELGLGLTTSLNDINEDHLDFLLRELLTNEKYRQNMQKRSELLRDRPIKPMDLATYWVEFVIRHNGTSHLRVEGLNLTWYQYVLLDVISVWTSVVVGTLYVIYILLTKMVHILTRSRKTKMS